MTQAGKQYISGDVLKNKDTDNVITKEELDTLKAASQERDALKAELEEASKIKTEIETLKAQLAEQDTLKAKLKELEDEKQAVAKQNMTDVVKGYTFVADEDKEALVDALLKSSESKLFLDTLEKARTAVAAITDEKGHDTEGQLEVSDTNKAVNNYVTELLKSRNNQ